MGKKESDRQTAGDEVARVECQDTGKDDEVSPSGVEEKTGVSKARDGDEEELDFARKEEEQLGEDGEDSEPKDDELVDVDGLKDQLLRALAETENVRKRGERDREEAVKYGITSLSRDIVGIADNLKRALENLPTDPEQTDAQVKSLREGVALTQQELETVLARHGIERIEALGEPFDHNFHQAMFEVEDEDHSAGTVVQVLQQGYRIHGRLLRPAMVGVAKKKGESAES
jgi:molecular chaperone GrpE